MSADRKLVWMVEYVIGLGLLMIAVPFIAAPQPGWSDAHGWAYLLFLVCSGITLISSASAAREGAQLAERIAKLEQMTERPRSAGKQVPGESGQRRTASEHLVGSVN
jgi:hypothetical protein